MEDGNICLSPRAIVSQENWGEKNEKSTVDWLKAGW